MVHQQKLTNNKPRIQIIQLVNVLVLVLIMLKIKSKKLDMLLPKKLTNKKLCIEQIINFSSDI